MCSPPGDVCFVNTFSPPPPSQLPCVGQNPSLFVLSTTALCFVSVPVSVLSLPITFDRPLGEPEACRLFVFTCASLSSSASRRRPPACLLLQVRLISSAPNPPSITNSPPVKHSFSSYWSLILGPPVSAVPDTHVTRQMLIRTYMLCLPPNPLPPPPRPFPGLSPSPRRAASPVDCCPSRPLQPSPNWSALLG